MVVEDFKLKKKDEIREENPPKSYRYFDFY